MRTLTPPTPLVAITGGRGTGRVARVAQVRSQAAAGLPSGVAYTRAHDVGPITDVVRTHAGNLPPGQATSVFAVSAIAGYETGQVWVCLVWGYLEGRLHVIGIDGDTRGGVDTAARQVATELALTETGMLTDGGHAERGSYLCITLAAVVIEPAP